MILGVLVGIGSSLSDFARHGQLERLVNYYFPAYLERFDRLRVFSYEPEHLEELTDDQLLRGRVELVAPLTTRRPRAHAVRLGFGRGRALLRSCSVVRALHAPGALPAALAGARYACTYGYSYPAETTVRAPRALGEPALATKRAVIRGELRFVLARAAATIVTSAAGAQEAQRLGARNLIKIPNGIDTGLFAPGDREPDFDVAYIGALNPGKDVATLLRAVALLSRDVRVCIAGDGPERELLERLAAAERIDAVFLGTVPNSDAAQLLRRSRCYVLPSLREGQPKALLEAMAAGCACLATDIEAVREIAPGGEVVVFPPSDAESLAHRLHELLGDCGRAGALGQHARARVVADFNLARLLEVEVELLASLARARASDPAAAQRRDRTLS